MKSMLYVGATLMIGASIYGFVDYKQTRQKDEFTSMYESKKSTAPAVAEEKEVVVAEKKEPVAIVKKTKNPVSKKNLAIKTVAEEDVIPAIKPISEEAKITDKETKTIEKTTVNAKASGKTVIKKKKKRINSKIFSRAPLREEEEIVIEPAKEVKKTENKEQ